MSLQNKIRQAYRDTPCHKVKELSKLISKWQRKRTIAENKLERLLSIQKALCDELASQIVNQNIEVERLKEKCGEKEDPGTVPDGYQRLEVIVSPAAIEAVSEEEDGA